MARVILICYYQSTRREKNAAISSNQGLYKVYATYRPLPGNHSGLCHRTQQLAATIEQPVIRTVIQAMFYTGGRISEMINLKLEDVDLENKMLHIIDGKGGKDRDVPINDKLHRIFTHYLKHIRGAGSERFFALARTGKVSASYINRCIHDAVDELGWEKDISAHVLRHSFGSNLLEKGASVVSIQKLLGHSSLRVTSRYLHQDTDKLSEAVNLL